MVKQKKNASAWPKKPHNPKKLIEQGGIPNSIEYDFLEAREMCSEIGIYKHVVIMFYMLFIYLFNGF